MVALTFDDGPDPVWTPRVLDALDAAGVRASFFPLSPRAAAYPELVARTRAAGHLVGLHGWAHLKHSESTRDEVEADTDRALAALDFRPAWWRLPYGMAASWSAELAAARGLRVVGWTHDTHDWRGDTAAEMLGRTALTSGEDAVVLAHDGLGPGVRRPGCDETVALIEPLVARTRSAGHDLVRVDELAQAPAGRT